MDIRASVKSVNLEGVVKTYFEIYVLDSTGTLPDVVDSIQITGPSGVLPHNKVDFAWRDDAIVSTQFFLDVEGAPEAGLYTFSLTIGGDTQEDTDTQESPSSIPAANITGPTGQVAAGDIDFTWDPVTYAGDKYYGIRIKTAGGTTIVNSPRLLDDLLHTENLSVGNYQFIVIVQDSSNWQSVNNRSMTAWSPFEVI